MIIKIVNDTTEYNDLVFTLLVFETYFRIINNDISSLFIIERAKVIKITINEVVKLYVIRQTNDVLYQRNDFQIIKMHDTSIGFSMLIWRTYQKKWIGSYKLLSIFREIKTCIIELLNDIINFRIIIVKPYLKKSNIFIQDSIQDSI